MTRTIALTVSPHTARGLLAPDSAAVGYDASTTTGRLSWTCEDTGGAWLYVSADGYQSIKTRALLPDGANELPWGEPGQEQAIPLTLTPATAPALGIDGDHFIRGGARFWVRGSTDFSLPAFPAQRDAVIADRVALGCNWFRILSMKFNNTGYEFLPNSPGHDDAMRATYDAIGNAGAYCQATIFADTRALLKDPSAQQDYWARMIELARPYAAFVLLDLCNEWNHATQDLDPQRFAKPTGFLSSHGAGLTDAPGVTPYWDWTSYHARRSPAPGDVNDLNAKPFNNCNGYEYHPRWPHRVVFVCAESVKPGHYGFNPVYARQMGLAAKVGAGMLAHHDAWLTCRPFTAEERPCISALYEALA